jgi:hypothetical protein
MHSPQARHGVIKILFSRTVLGKQAIDGESPVCDREYPPRRVPE